MSLILAGYVFSGPQSLKEFENTDIEGLFGIFYLKAPEKKVADYGVLYIGETPEIVEAEEFPSGHKKFSCWAERGKGEDNLYIGFCPTPGMMPKQKELIKKHLVYKYNPMCNK